MVIFMLRKRIATALTPIVATGLFILSATTNTQPPATSDAATYIGQMPAPRKLTPREYVRQRASRNGWTWRQWQCAARIVTKENPQWHVWRSNGQGSSAYGLFQILHMPKGTPLRQQTDRFFTYIASRYDNDPCKAWNHHERKGWY